MKDLIVILLVFSSLIWDSCTLQNKSTTNEKFGCTYNSIATPSEIFQIEDTTDYVWDTDTSTYLLFNLDGFVRYAKEVKPEKHRLPKNQEFWFYTSKDTLNIEKENLTIVIKSNTKSELTTGLNYEIEKLEDGIWVKCEPPFMMLVNDIALGVRPYGKIKFEIDFMKEPWCLDPGYYRIGKNIKFGGEWRTYYTEFIVK